MFAIARNSNKVTYGIKHFVVDTEQDLKELPLRNVYPGSTAIILETSAKYILNNQQKWIQIKGSVGNGSSTPVQPPSDDSNLGLDGGLVTEDGIIDGEDENLALDGGLII